MSQEEFAAFKQKALEQFKSGQSLTGKAGVFAPLLKDFIEAALESEMQAHLDEAERDKGNKRNGRKSKRLKSSAGELEIATPQDRHSSFEPELIKKRQTILADSLEDKILGLYARGMSFRDISAQIEQLYDMQVSHTVLSEITDRVLPQITAWQSRPLASTYVIVWLDAMYYKVRQDGKVVTRCLYNLLAINTQGHKELLGLYVGQVEGARFWLEVLTDLYNRGVQDILLACTDNLKGFEEAISSVFPKTELQLCLVHQVRHCLKYVARKHYRAVCKDFKAIYQADTLALAEMELDNFQNKWGKDYPLVVASWRRNWHRLSTYFDYTKPIRKLIYTTNPIEGMHRQIRKVTKNKGAFPSDQALLKLVWLATQQFTRQWNKALPNWGLAAQQLAIRFSERMPLELN